MICYTVITNNYDLLKPPRVVSKGWDYICFSDRHHDSKVWQTQVIEGDNRKVKILPQDELFTGVTLYIDGSIQVIGDLNEFVKEVGEFAIPVHIERDCTYAEAKAVVRLKNIDRDTVKTQVSRYRDNGFPAHWGLGANGVILRDTSDIIMRRICRRWWIEYLRGAKRDQLSLMYTCWRHNIKPDLFSRKIFDKYFKKGKHNKFHTPGRSSI